MRTDDGVFSRFMLVAALVVAIGAGPGSRAQTESPVTSELEEREEVRLIEINLIAVDSEGLVTDLDADGVEVTLDGKPLAIAGIQSASEARLFRQGLPKVRLQLQPGSEERIVSTALSLPRYWVFLIDVANDVPGELDTAKAGLEQFIRNDLEEVDYAAVVSYTGEVRMEQSFTIDRDAAVEAIDRAYSRSRTAGVPTPKRIRGLGNTLRTCEPPPDPEAGIGGGGGGGAGGGTGRFVDPDVGEVSVAAGSPVMLVQCAKFAASAYFEEMRSYSDRYYGAIEGALRLAGEAPGVPTVFAVSHGATVHPETEFIDALRGVFGEGQVFAISNELATTGAAAEIDRVVTLAEEQGVTVHFIDPAVKTSTTRSARDRNMQETMADPIETAWMAAQQDLRSVAQSTGGMFVADAGVVDGLRAALAREQGRYLLDVYAPAGFSAEQLEALEVVPRRPGVRIVHRNLPPDSSVTEDDDFQAGAAVRETRERDDGEPGQIQTFLVGARQADLDYAPDGANMVADLSMRVWVETAEGDHLAEYFHFFRHTRPRDQWEAASNATLAIRGWLEAPPGSYRLVALFRNAKTGKQGRAVMEIDVPQGYSDSGGR
ncbi:MAG: VWA domain-containing protein [Acidobacteriota bacterium]|nr:VWA domain-containing protein [Acidobacteriota bacterium]